MFREKQRGVIIAGKKISPGAVRHQKSDLIVNHGDVEMKHFMIVLTVAAGFAGSSITAEAGPFKDAAKGAIGTAVTGAKVGVMLTRCALKRKPGQIVC